MSSRDYRDWQAYFALERDVQDLVAKGVAPELATEAVWKTPDD